MKNNSFLRPWVNIEVVADHLCNYIGRTQIRQLENYWYKVKLPKKHLKAILYKEVDATRKLTEFDIRLSQKHKQLGRPSQILLYIEQSKPIRSLQKREHNSSTIMHPKCMGKCCVRHLIVDFDMLGIDWILTPRRYIANYCSGSCSQQYMDSGDHARLSSNAKVVQAMLTKLNISATGSTCVPSGHKPVTLIYKNHRGTIMSTSNSLKTVTSCKCV